MTTRLSTTDRRRLERAGFVCVVVAGKPGWVPQSYAKKVQFQAESYTKEVAEVLAEPRRPRGRPRKT